jgi:hypothetical protein
MSDPIYDIILHFKDGKKSRMLIIWIGNLDFFKSVKEDTLLFCVVQNYKTIQTYHLSTFSTNKGILNGYDPILVNTSLSFGWDSSNIKEGWSNILSLCKLKNYKAYIIYEGSVLDVCERESIDLEDMFKIDNGLFEIGRFDEINLYFITIKSSPHQDRSFVYMRSPLVNRYGSLVSIPEVKISNYRANPRSKVRDIIDTGSVMFSPIDTYRRILPKQILNTRDIVDPYAGFKIERRGSDDHDDDTQSELVRIINRVRVSDNCEW